MSTQPEPTLMPLLSVVSPVYNEAAGLHHFVARVREVLELAGQSFEIVLIDDGSLDDSWPAILDETVDPRVRGVRLSRNFGKEAALLAGLRSARGDAVVVLDSDLQHPPTMIPAMLARWRQGADVVEAVKRSRTGQPLPGRVAARSFNAMFGRLTGVDLADATDFRLLSRRAVDALLELPEHGSFFRGTSAWIGFRRDRIEIHIDPRTAGRSQWTFRTLVRLGVNGVTSFTSAPLHLVTLAGVVFAVFSVLLGAQTLVERVRGESVAGYPTVVLVLLVMGTFILLGLGIIGEYLARIYEEVRARPRYLVEEHTDALVDVRPRLGPVEDPRDLTHT